MTYKLIETPMKHWILYINIILVCICAQSCAIDKAIFDKYTIGVIDNTVYLDDKTFKNGEVFGELPIETHWNSIRPLKNNIVIKGQVWTPRTKETIPYSTIYLVTKCKGKYEIVKMLKHGNSKGFFHFKLKLSHIKKYYLAVYAPGCKTIIYEVIDQ